MFYSVIVPVYNRPEEIDELLESLSRQSYRRFEVIIVEDGSQKDCRNIVESYSDKLNIRYYYKENTGQGFSRNYGFERAGGDYLVVFDSDCLIPPDYFEIVNSRLQTDPVDAWGGPDRAHPDFSILQKAISYSMTSPLTTGGVRGSKRQLAEFDPRSFNMGISREVFEKTGGYRITRMGEDIEFSLRIREYGFRTALFPEAFVYHKRRTTLTGFYRQLFFFGRARINIGRFYPGEIRLFHWFPSFFLAGLLLMAIMGSLCRECLVPLSIPLQIYLSAIAIHALWSTGSVRIAGLSLITSMIQLVAYGAGFLRERISRNTIGVRS